MRKIIFTTIFFLSIDVASLAQVIEFKILASDGSAEDWFGWSVSISEDYSIVGALADDDNGDGSGSAYIFRRDGTNWIDEQKLIASDGNQEDHFGGSVSISGNYAIIGAFSDDDNGEESGSAYIFRMNGTKWIEEQKLTASDGVEYDQFRGSASIFADYAIVGAPSVNVNGKLNSSAYIFRRNDTTWIEQQKLTSSDGSAHDWYGYSVSISEDYNIVGAPLNKGHGINSGSAYVYTNFIVGIEDEHPEIPLSFRLKQNYPNPFNPSTTIKFSLPSSGYATLKIYNVLGEEVAVLLDKEITTGTYEVEWNADGFTSGIYFYQLKTGSFVQTKKMILLK